FRRGKHEPEKKAPQPIHSRHRQGRLEQEATSRLGAFLSYDEGPVSDRKESSRHQRVSCREERRCIRENLVHLVGRILPRELGSRNCSASCGFSDVVSCKGGPTRRQI